MLKANVVFKTLLENSCDNEVNYSPLSFNLNIALVDISRVFT